MADLQYSPELRAKARVLWLSGEYASDAEIAKQVGDISPATIGRWRRDEDWGADRARLREVELRKLAEKKVEAINTWLDPLERIGKSLMSSVAHHLSRTDANGERIHPDPQNLKRLADTMAQVQHTIWKSFGIDRDEGELAGTLKVEYVGLDAMARAVIEQLESVTDQAATGTLGEDMDHGDNPSEDEDGG